jgi:hypothetical protein
MSVPLVVAAATPPTAPAALPTHVTITPWVDPLVDSCGHDPRSDYVERFWLGTLGPTATWLLRRLVDGLARHPDGYLLDLRITAQSLGLSHTSGQSSPFARAFGRCVMFGLAHQRSAGYSVRRRIPDVTQRHLARLPEEIRRAHEVWRAAPEDRASAVPPGVCAPVSSPD